MKRIVSMLMVIVFLVTSMSIIGCGDTKSINGKTYDTYGLFNKDDKRNSDIEYEIIYGNIVWSVLLCSTVIAPIYFLGFSMYEPIGVRIDKTPGVINSN